MTLVDLEDAPYPSSSPSRDLTLNAASPLVFVPRSQDDRTNRIRLDLEPLRNLADGVATLMKLQDLIGIHVNQPSCSGSGK